MRRPLLVLTYALWAVALSLLGLHADLGSAGGGPYGQPQMYFMGPVGIACCTGATLCAMRSLAALLKRP